MAIASRGTYGFREAKLLLRPLRPPPLFLYIAFREAKLLLYPLPYF